MTHTTTVARAQKKRHFSLVFGPLKKRCYRKQNILVSTPAGRKIARRRRKILRFLSPRCIRKRTSLKDLKHLNGLNFQIPSRTLEKDFDLKSKSILKTDALGIL